MLNNLEWESLELCKEQFDHACSKVEYLPIPLDYTPEFHCQTSLQTRPMFTIAEHFCNTDRTYSMNSHFYLCHQDYGTPCLAKLLKAPQSNSLKSTLHATLLLCTYVIANFL